MSLALDHFTNGVRIRITVIREDAGRSGHYHYNTNVPTNASIFVEKPMKLLNDYTTYYVYLWKISLA
jgi:hypothetical protein